MSLSGSWLQKKSLLLTGDYCTLAVTSLVVLTCIISPVIPALAKDADKAVAVKTADKAAPAKADDKAALAKTADKASPAASDKVEKSKHASRFDEKIVGAKSAPDLVKKVEAAYTKKDTSAYLSLLQAPIRSRIRMKLQFKRDSNGTASNFKYVTVAQEAARIKDTDPSFAKAKTVAGVVEDYDLPVVGYIDFQLASSTKQTIGLPVGKGKDGYYLVMRHAPEGSANFASATATPPAPGPAPAPARAH